MLDCHTHILPDMDKGHLTAENGRTLLNMEYAQGVTHILLTPHYRRHKESAEAFLQRRAAAYACLKASEFAPVKLALGAETSYYEGMAKDESIECMFLGTSRVLLVELPKEPWTKAMFDELCALKRERNIQPLLAHVDRYRKQMSKGVMSELREKGMLMQLNATALLKLADMVRSVYWLRRDFVQYLGSDTYSIDRRPPNMKEASEKIRRFAGREALSRMKQNEETMIGEVFGEKEAIYEDYPYERR